MGQSFPGDDSCSLQDRETSTELRAMSEDLSIQGTLAETTVPDLLRSLMRSGETAILSLERSDRMDRLFMIDGQIVFATSSDADSGVAEAMLRGGDINLQHYDTLLDKVAASQKIGAAICELGYLQPDELLGVFERQVSQIVLEAIGFRSGSYSIEFTSNFGPDVMTLPLKTDRLVIDGIEAVEHWSLIQRGLGKMDRIVRQAETADTRLFRLELNSDESHVFSLVSEAQPVQLVLERSYLSNYDTARIVWALQSVNLIEDAETSQVHQQRRAVENAIELESNVEKYNSVFQAIFRLVFQRIGDYTWDFVDRVVQHVSPEVFPYLSGISLVNEGRVDFDQLMNNLIASGSSDQRTVVYTVLNELLYGWIYEIKREFDEALESDVNAIVRTLTQ